MNGAETGEHVDALERRGNVNAATEGNHVLAIPSLHGSEFSLLGTLIVCRSEGGLKTGVRLEKPVESVAIANRN